MIFLDVTLTLPDNTTIFCGEIAVDELNSEGAFRYSPEYLKHPKAFSLDPVSLPLSSNEYSIKNKEGLHAVFEDALPDDWGRKILIQKADLSRNEQRAVNLLIVLGANGLGALSFAKENQKTTKTSPAEIVKLPDLLEAAFLYDAGLPVSDEQVKMLHIHGGSPGGARPKTVVQKEDKSLWIAKFPRQDDSYQVEALEAGCLELARRAKLYIPEFELRAVGKRKALLVKRFDISNEDGRYHMISMQTILKATGYYQLGYKDLFDALRKYSYQPSVDLPALFRQMVFNSAIGNTDDHLKNFCMIHDENGFCLSPTYDIVPDIAGNREHTLSFPLGHGFLHQNRTAFQRIGETFKIVGADNIINDVYLAVSNWKDIFKKYDVPDNDIQRLEWGIDRRCNALKK